MTSIEFNVAGAPPLKNIALSFLNPTHPHADSVRALLEAAHAAKLATSFTGFCSVPLGLEMVVRRSTAPVMWDATNALGGVGDVLQARRTNVDLTALGELADAFLFDDDNQIREVVYREEPGALGYRLRLWTLEL